MNSYFSKPWFLSVLSGLLLFICWPPMPFPFIIFFSIVPILWLTEIYISKSSEEYNDSKSIKTKRYAWTYFGWTYLAFLIWNSLTTWWVFKASPAAVFAITLNSLFMTVPLVLYFHTRKRFNFLFSSIALIGFWLSFEYIHLRWDISWPWLTLGNVFAEWPSTIQWYEFTGVAGGTFWIWVVNLMIVRLFVYIKNLEKTETQSLLQKSALIDMVILIPIVISLIIDKTYTESSKSETVLLVQPNIDPYTEKFNGLSAEDQLYKMLELAATKLDSSVSLLVLPETAITSTTDESEIELNEEVVMLRKLMLKYPKLEILTGITTVKIYQAGEEKSATARQVGDFTFADYYNTAIYIKQNRPIQFYHKSKLVPGVEKMPFPAVFSFLESFAIENGGISGSLGTDKEPSVMNGTKIKSAPVICYESIYGDYVRKYIAKGANLIAIITNDGWWGNTDGYQQHLVYGTTRAIETRRSIARCANTGISAFVDERGRIYKRTSWWEPDVLKGKVTLSNKQTFYTWAGDYISYMGIAVSIFFLIAISIKKKKLMQNE